MFKIGNVILKNNIVLAPLAGYTNSAFRKIIKEMGIGLIYTEMISDKGLIYENKKTDELLYVTDFERPISCQLFGSDKESFVKAAKIVIEKMHPDIIDINMGCPVPKVALRSQAGSALLKDVNKIKEIVKAVVDTVEIPVTVKIRSGWDDKNINAKEVAIACEESGASAICIHGRTRSQGYSGKVNLDIIKEVKESVNIPVIGNGDIKTLDDAKKMFDYTKCDAIMIGRMALENPFFIKELVSYFENGIILNKSTYKDKIELALKHFNYLLEIKNEKQAVLEMRSIASFYIKGLPSSIKIKNELFKIKDKENLINLLNNYLKELENSIE